jgi:predicted nucleotidyltransferase
LIPDNDSLFMGMVAVENRLTELLGARVDLSPAKILKEPVRDKASEKLFLRPGVTPNALALRK